MLNRQETAYILLVALILGFLVALRDIAQIFYIFLSFILIILINVTAKKIVAFNLDSEIEIKLWELKRFGIKPHQHFKKPLAAGIIFPFLSKIIFFPFKYFIWMASLVFSVKAKTYRASKRFGLYAFSEVPEYHIALIASSGIIANLLFAFLGYVIGTPSHMEFVKLSIYFAFFNLIPFSNLDGNKIFFGSQILWVFLASITSISLISALLVV